MLFFWYVTLFISFGYYFFFHFLLNWFGLKNRSNEWIIPSASRVTVQLNVNMHSNMLITTMLSCCCALDFMFTVFNVCFQMENVIIVAWKLIGSKMFILWMELDVQRRDKLLKKKSKGGPQCLHQNPRAVYPIVQIFLSKITNKVVRSLVFFFWETYSSTSFRWDFSRVQSSGIINSPTLPSWGP